MTGEAKCYYCHIEMVETDIDASFFIDEYFSGDNTRRKNIMGKLHQKFVFPSPEFNQEEFDKREEKDKKDELEIEEKYAKEEHERNTPTCPKCGSTALSANKKGFGLGKAVAGGALAGTVGLLGGFIGSNKVECTCLNCGYKFAAGKK